MAINGVVRLRQWKAVKGKPKAPRPVPAESADPRHGGKFSSASRKIKQINTNGITLTIGNAAGNAMNKSAVRHSIQPSPDTQVREKKEHQEMQQKQGEIIANQHRRKRGNGGIRSAATFVI